MPVGYFLIGCRREVGGDIGRVQIYLAFSAENLELDIPVKGIGWERAHVRSSYYLLPHTHGCLEIGLRWELQRGRRGRGNASTNM